MMYRVDLLKFGITKGALPNPTSTEDNVWNIAKNTTEGINAAMLYAYDNGYSGIRLPKGNYTVVYLLNTDHSYLNNRALVPYSNQIVDLGGSTIDVLYSSEFPSPFREYHRDKPAYYLAGNLFETKRVSNVTIRNGELKGDVYRRTFKNDVAGFREERWMENTVGVKQGAGTYNCTFEHLNIHGFMGDGQSGSTHENGSSILRLEVNGAVKNKPLPPASNRGVIGADGKIQPTKEGSFVSEKLYLDLEELYRRTPFSPRTFQIQGSGGYNRTPGLPNNNIKAVFYNDANQIVNIKTIRPFERVVLPFAAAYFRLQFNNINTTADRFPDSDVETAVTWTITESVSSGTVIRKCKIHDNHRGGIANPCDNITIENNEIFSNGMDCGIGAPIFPDTTRYQINFEDTFANNATIRNNEIYNGFNGILLNIENVVVEGNIISDLSSGVILYSSVNTAVVKHNKFYNTNSFRYQGYNKGTHIFSENFVHGGGLNLDNVTANLRLSNNLIESDSLYITGNVTLDNNTFEGGGSYYQVLIKNGSGNTFNGKGKIANHIIISEGFGNEVKNFSMIASNIPTGIKIKGTRFENSFIRRNPIAPTETDTYTNCQFIDTTVGFPSGANMPETITKSSIEFIDCKIDNKVPLLYVKDNKGQDASGREYAVSFNGSTDFNLDGDILKKEYVSPVKLSMTYNSQGALNKKLIDKLSLIK